APSISIPFPPLPRLPELRALNSPNGCLLQNPSPLMGEAPRRAASGRRLTSKIFAVRQCDGFGRRQDVGPDARRDPLVCLLVALARARAVPLRQGVQEDG